MIHTKKELKFYIIADRIMNGMPEKRSIFEALYFDYGKVKIVSYLRAMRYYAYYVNTTHKRFSLRSLIKQWWGHKYNKLGMKLGLSIGFNSIGYGLVIPHFGTIIVNGDARVGNYACIHTCTCIAGRKIIGDYFYLSTGSQITGDIVIGNGVTVAAHSLVNHSTKDNVLLAGAPAEEKKNNYPIWTDRDGISFKKRVDRIKEIERLYSIETTNTM